MPLNQEKIHLLVKQVKNSGGPRVLTPQEIKLRLHLYNLTQDFTLFADVISNGKIGEDQSVSVMYPDVIYPIGTKREDRPAYLEKLFGPLPEPTVEE